MTWNNKNPYEKSNFESPTMSDGGWSSDDDAGFGGGLTMEEIAAGSANKTASLLDATFDRMYGENSTTEIPDTGAVEPTETKGHADGFGFSSGGYDPWGGASAASPETPCHEEWPGFANIRLRGHGFTPSDQATCGTNNNPEEGSVLVGNEMVGANLPITEIREDGAKTETAGMEDGLAIVGTRCSASNATGGVKLPLQFLTSGSPLHLLL